MLALCLEMVVVTLLMACPPYYPVETVDISDSVEIKFDDDIKVGERIPLEVVFAFDTSDLSYSEMELYIYPPNDSPGLPSFKAETSDGKELSSDSVRLMELGKDIMQSGSLTLYLTFYQQGDYSFVLNLRARNEAAYSAQGGKVGFFSSKRIFEVSFPFVIEPTDISDYVKVDFDVGSVVQGEKIPLEVSLDFSDTDFVYAELCIYSYSKWDVEAPQKLDNSGNRIFLVLNGDDVKKYNLLLQVSFPDSEPNMVSLNLIARTQNAGLEPGGKGGEFSREFNFFVKSESEAR